MFESFGEIINAVVLKDDRGMSKGFGFVCFKDSKCAENAYSALNGKKFFNDPELPSLYVNFAMKKQERIELLKKQKAELFRTFQKLTIYVKVKDESKIV
jgi:polyadenylate-binding protein